MEENTALHVAANAGKEKAVEVLLKHGADTKALNDEGKTPLDLAKNWHTAKYERIADMLSAHEWILSRASFQLQTIWKCTRHLKEK